MKTACFYRALALGVVIFLLSTDTIHAASEHATFKSFYKKSSIFGIWVNIHPRLEEYYAKLEEKSENMTTLTLPMPVNQSGPESYENALEILNAINDEEPIFSSSNRGIISKAIRIGRAGENDALVEDEDRARQQALLSLLYFVSNDYVRAKKHAGRAIYYAQKVEIEHTLPTFIFATSSLYEENVQFDSITEDYFRRAILDEPDNPIIPLLFSIYLDRLSLRFNDTNLNEGTFARIFRIMQNPELEDYQLFNYLAILVRYSIQLELYHQKLMYFTNTSNQTIKNDPITLKTVKDTLKRYEGFLNGSRTVTTEIVFLDSGLDDDIKSYIKEWYSLLEKYADDRIRLASLVNGLEASQTP